MRPHSATRALAMLVLALVCGKTHAFLPAPAYTETLLSSPHAVSATNTAAGVHATPNSRTRPALVPLNGAKKGSSKGNSAPLRTPGLLVLTRGDCQSPAPHLSYGQLPHSDHSPPPYGGYAGADGVRIVQWTWHDPPRMRVDDVLAMSHTDDAYRSTRLMHQYLDAFRKETRLQPSTRVFEATTTWRGLCSTL